MPHFFPTAPRPDASRLLDDSGFRRLLRRSTITLLLALVLPVLLLLAVVNILLRAANSLDHADLVLAQANHMDRTLTHMESSLRGYIISKDERFLEPYSSGETQIDGGFKSLAALAADNSVQAAAAATLRTDVENWRAFCQEAIAMGRAGQPSPIPLAFQLRGKDLMSLVRTRIDAFITAEERYRAARDRKLDRAVTGIFAILAVGALAGIPALSLWLQRRLREVSGIYRHSLTVAERHASELHAALTSIGDAVIATDAQGKVDFLNPTAEMLTGWPTAEARGRDLAEVFNICDEQTGSPAENPIARVLREERVIGLGNHTVLRPRAGGLVPIEDSAAPIRGESGRVLGAIVVFHDVSDKREAERRLADAEWRARTALEVGSAGSWMWEMDANVITGSEMIAKTFGIPVERCVAGVPLDSFLHAVHREDRARVQSAIQLAVNTGSPYECEYRVRRSDGGERWVHARGRIDLDAAGHPVRMPGFLIDITERKHAESALQASENLKTAILDTSLDGFILMDHEGRITDWNAAAARIFGAPRTQVLGKLLGDTIVPEYLRSRHREGLARYLATREERILGRRYEFPALRADGSEFPSEISFTHIPGTEPPVFAGYVRDITERKRSEEALRTATEQAEAGARAVAEAAERFRLLAEVVSLQVWTARFSGDLDYANQEIAKYFGTDLEHGILGDAWTRFVHPDDLPGVMRSWQNSLATGARYEMEFRLLRTDGEFRWFLVRAEAMRNSQGLVVKWFGTNTDIHDLKMAQRDAERASRAKDSFLAALSHELRTPLTPVLMTAAALREDERLPADVREQLGMLERNIALEVRLIDDLLDLTGIARGKLFLHSQLFDAHSVIGLAIEIVLDDALAKGITIERELDALCSGLTADPARFQQVMWNLLRNAVKFTPRGGRIAIRTHNKADDGNAQWLHIEVIDSGIGIDPSALEQIFLPFDQGGLTGDHRFGGIGLGLAIARTIVDLHGGRISARSAGTDCGATFIVELPGAADAPHGVAGMASPSSGLLSAGAPYPAPDAAGENPLRLLLVEDHEPTLQVLSRMLTRAGHSVVGARTVAEALAAAAANTFDAVISDLGLPDGTGTDLMERLRDAYRLRGIALSGYGMAADIARSLAAGFSAHLIKPIDFTQLRRALTALDEL